MIQEVVIPIAGLGTRFLPFTKSVSKEMLPLMNKPAIHYILEEAVASGIRSCCFITGRGKPMVADYLSPSKDLHDLVKARDRLGLLTHIDILAAQMKVHFIEQVEPIGLGDAILRAQASIVGDFFGVMLPDDIICGTMPGLMQLMNFAKQEQVTVIAVQEVPQSVVSSYGVIAIKNRLNDYAYEVADVVEKPDIDKAPSALAIVGRYVLSRKIFEILEHMAPTQGELQLTDGIAQMIKQGEPVFAYKIQGDRYDIGVPSGFIKAMISLALQDPRYKDEIKQFIMDKGIIENPASDVKSLYKSPLIQE